MDRKELDENDDTFGELDVTDEEFAAFRERHAGVEQMVSEATMR